MRTKITLGLLGLLASSGCVTAYSTMSTHTIDVGPSRTADVVWVLESNRGLLRCYESQGGPVCVRVKMTDTPAPVAEPPPPTVPPVAAPPTAPDPAPAPGEPDDG